MLRIYPVALDWIEKLEPLIARIARGDRELATQLRRASASVVLNMAEGMGARDGHRTNAYGVSLREMRESYAALQVAQRRRLIGALDAALDAQCQRLIGTLVRLAVPQRR
jgi:four helix bundle protein